MGAHRAVRAARRILRSPKGYMLVLVGVISTLGSIPLGFAVTVPGAAAAAGAASLTDLLIRVVLRRKLEFPSGALLTGHVVALVLDPYAPPFVPAVAAAIAIVAKHLLRDRSANLFNPAAVGLIAIHLIFGHGESWWGGLPDYGLVGVLLVLIPGAWIADHINKLPLILAFFATYFSLFAVTAFTPSAIEVAEVFGAPGVHMAVFFACYMLDDPPTSPTRYFDQIWYGVLVAGLAYAIFMMTGVVYFLAGALLLGNVANDVRRHWRAQHRHRPAPAYAGSRGGLQGPS